MFYKVGGFKHVNAGKRVEHLGKWFVKQFHNRQVQCSKIAMLTSYKITPVNHVEMVLTGQRLAHYVFHRQIAMHIIVHLA